MAIRQGLVTEAIGFARALENAAAHFARSAPDDALRSRRAHLYALAATLRDATELQQPVASLVEPLRDALNALPPQRAGDETTDPFSQWIRIAALADQDGDYAVAGLMMTAMLRHLATAPASDALSEQRAICWTRRGRLSRQLGEIDNAEECYCEALRIVRGKPTGDAWAQAHLGMCNVHSLRGNIPQMERSLRRVVAHRPAVPTVYRASAHQALTDVCRRRGQFMDALLHGWQAYDLLERGDIRRFEVMAVLAQVALEAGELDAAERGYRLVVASRGPERMMSPASIGLARTQVKRLKNARAGSERMRSLKALTEALAGVQEVLDHAVQPAERANLLIALGEGRLALGDWSHAEVHLTAALELGTQLGFNKKVFQAEELLTRLEAERRGSPSVVTASNRQQEDDRSPQRRAKTGKAHPAVLRLLQFDAT